MLKIKGYFSGETTEISYQKEFKRLVIIILAAGFTVLIDFLTMWIITKDVINPIFILIARLVFVFFYVILMFLILFSLGRFVNISDKKEKKSIKNGTKKFKHSPINYPLKDIIFVFENYDIPDTIYIKDPLNKIHTLELSMDFDARKNVFFDRQFLIDGNIFHAIDQFIEYIINNSFCDDFENIKIVSLIDNNNPQLFEKVISQCKEKYIKRLQKNQ